MVLFRWAGSYHPTEVHPAHEPGWSQLMADLKSLPRGATGTVVTFKAGSSQIGAVLVREVFVQEESAELVGDVERGASKPIDNYVPTAEELRYIATCDSRFEIGYTDDPEMDGYSEALFVAEYLCQAAGGRGRAFTFSTGLGAFIPPVEEPRG